MRKSLVVVLCTAACVLAASSVFHVIGGRDDIVRYHQHLEQPSEKELAPCEVCGGKGDLCTHLPIINVETGGQKIPGKAIPTPEGTLAGYETGKNGETEILVDLSTVESENAWHHPDDAPTLKGSAQFRVRGNSSRWFPKSSYRIRLVEKDNPEKEERLPLLGMTSGTEWALYGPFLDKTLIRNYMWMNLSAEIMGYAPNVRFCEVTMDGKYQGLYLLMETIAVSVQEGRLDLTEYRDGDPVCSYLLRIEPNLTSEKLIDNFTFYTDRMEKQTRMELIYPGLKHQSKQVRDYVQTDISEIEKLLYSVDMVNGSGNYRDYIDLDSFVDYYIIQEFLAVNDTFSASTYFYRDVRGKLQAGPVWDYNNSLNNFLLPMPRDAFLLAQRGWFGQLMCDEAFVERVISRYQSLRKGILSDKHLLEYTYQTDSWLGSAVDRNFKLWGYSFDPSKLSHQVRRRPDTGSGLGLEEVNPASHEEAIQWMVDYMIGRAHWMDEHIQTLRQYCHPSKYAVWALG